MRVDGSDLAARMSAAIVGRVSRLAIPSLEGVWAGASPGGRERRVTSRVRINTGVKTAHRRAAIVWRISVTGETDDSTLLEPGHGPTDSFLFLLIPTSELHYKPSFSEG